MVDRSSFNRNIKLKTFYNKNRFILPTRNETMTKIFKNLEALNLYKRFYFIYIKAVKQVNTFI